MAKSTLQDIRELGDVLAAHSVSYSFRIPKQHEKVGEQFSHLIRNVSIKATSIEIFFLYAENINPEVLFDGLIRYYLSITYNKPDGTPHRKSEFQLRYPKLLMDIDGSKASELVIGVKYTIGYKELFLEPSEDHLYVTLEDRPQHPGTKGTKRYAADTDDEEDDD